MVALSCIDDFPILSVHLTYLSTAFLNIRLRAWTCIGFLLKTSIALIARSVLFALYIQHCLSEPRKCGHLDILDCCLGLEEGREYSSLVGNIPIALCALHLKFSMLDAVLVWLEAR